MDKRSEAIVQTLKERHAASLEETRGEVHVFLTRDAIIAALTLARDDHKFELLSTMTAIDYWPQTSPRFHVIYQLSSLANNVTLQFRVPVDEHEAPLPTASGVYEAANWREREIAEMFGITFDGHPDPRPLMLPHDMEGHPLRRDFPLGYEEPQFTFNYEEIDLRKPYAKE